MERACILEPDLPGVESILPVICCMNLGKSFNSYSFSFLHWKTGYQFPLITDKNIKVFSCFQLHEFKTLLISLATGSKSRTLVCFLQMQMDSGAQTLAVGRTQSFALELHVFSGRIALGGAL